jgi:hypothetical protein
VIGIATKVIGNHSHRRGGCQEFNAFGFDVNP